MIFSLLLLPLFAESLSLTDAARWQKWDRHGHAVAPLAGPWHCIEDRATGLFWEVKTDNETLHFAGASYSWFDGQTGQPDAGSCANGDEYYGCDSQDLIAHSRSEALCGFRDWRLPTAAELTGILFWQAYPGEAKVIGTLFPYLLRTPYWTADRSQDANGKPVALTLHLGDGTEQWLPLSRVARVILVRGPSR